MQAVRQPRNHGLYHGGLLVRCELRCRCHIFCAWTRAWTRTWTRAWARRGGHPRDLLANELGPGRIRRCARQHGAPNLHGRRRLAVLLGRNAEEIPRLDVPAIELDGARKRLLGLRSDLAVTRRDQSFAEPSLPLRGFAVERKRVAPRFDGIVDAANPQIDRRNHLPAATIVRIASEMALDLRNHPVDRLARVARSERLTRQARRAER